MAQRGKAPEAKADFSTLLGNPAQTAGFPHIHSADGGSSFQSLTALCHWGSTSASPRGSCTKCCTCSVNLANPPSCHPREREGWTPAFAGVTTRGARHSRAPGPCAKRRGRGPEHRGRERQLLPFLWPACWPSIRLRNWPRSTSASKLARTRRQLRYRSPKRLRRLPQMLLAHYLPTWYILAALNKKIRAGSHGTSFVPWASRCSESAKATA